MSQPVWDGKGEDPWLPERLERLLAAAEGERVVWESVWAELSAWMVRTSRRVLARPLPSPEEVHAAQPAWELAVGRIIAGAVLPVMEWAYDATLGTGYRWRERATVLSYLSGVRNRLVRVPDEVYSLVAGQIAAGVTLGEGIPEISERVEEVLSVTATPRWENRATVIARTEALGALNHSRKDAFTVYAEENPDDEYDLMWLATRDTHTRETHRLADGDRVPIGTPFIVGGFALNAPGDPAGPAQEVIQCRCTTLLLKRGENRPPVLNRR